VSKAIQRLKANNSCLLTVERKEEIKNRHGESKSMSTKEHTETRTTKIH